MRKHNHILRGLCVMICILCTSFAMAQKELGDCTIHYSVRFMKDSALVNVAKIVYIHGAQVRTDLFSDLYSQTIISGDNSGLVYILKDARGNKYKMILDSIQWQKNNEVYKNAKTSIIDDDVSIILGYRCGKALQTLKDGNKFYVYYTLDVVPSAKENAFQFADIPGVVLRYESVSDSGAMPIEIRANSINLMPLSSQLFQVPTKGYKVLKNPNF